MRWILFGLIVGAGLMLENKRRVRAFYRGPWYVQQIQAWKPETTLDLPPIQPLKGRKA